MVMSTCMFCSDMPDIFWNPNMFYQKKIIILDDKGWNTAFQYLFTLC